MTQVSAPASAGSNPGPADPTGVASPADRRIVDAAVEEAIGAVEEQMGELAGHIRASIRDTALRIDPALAPFGLKMLRVLARCGPTHASVAADLLFVDRSVVSRQARQLEELGLIELQTDPSDGRARFLTLTAAAAEKLGAARATDSLLSHNRLSTWSIEDLHRFAGYIARLNDRES
ncbi:MarR family winged helix-turn-helix transcriptional regulator [Glaciibacter sp. 2TAF33]|uniref:MarR family winged helix-turn-helix transcriptional regulator n=1 Tax=Glaciibacter sp. 2TAF33 TaxID=3233015 RepID=UPI003F8DFE9F